MHKALIIIDDCCDVLPRFFKGIYIMRAVDINIVFSLLLKMTLVRAAIHWGYKQPPLKDLHKGVQHNPGTSLQVPRKKATIH